LSVNFRAYVKPIKQPQHFIDNELRPNAEVFERVLEPDPARPARYRLLKGLHQLDNQDWQPPAIKFIVDHHANDAGVDQFLKRLDRLASYFLFITRANVNERLLRYAALLSGIEADTALADDSALELSDQEKLGLRTMLDGDFTSTSAHDGRSCRGLMRCFPTVPRITITVW
jgi:hypothetical protein